jgi:hypothetical protein
MSEACMSQALQHPLHSHCLLKQLLLYFRRCCWESGCRWDRRARPLWTPCRRCCTTQTTSRAPAARCQLGGIHLFGGRRQQLVDLLLQHHPNTPQGNRYRVQNGDNNTKENTFLDAAASSCLTCSCSASSILIAATGRGAAFVRFDLCAAAVLACRPNTCHVEHRSRSTLGFVDDLGFLQGVGSRSQPCCSHDHRHGPASAPVLGPALVPSDSQVMQTGRPKHALMRSNVKQRSVHTLIMCPCTAPSGLRPPL